MGEWKWPGLRALKSFTTQVLSLLYLLILVKPMHTIARLSDQWNPGPEEELQGCVWECEAKSKLKGKGVCRTGRRRGPYCKEQGWDGSAALHMDHGQHAGKVAFPGSSKEQPGREKSRSAWDGPQTTKGSSLHRPGSLIHAPTPASAHTGASPLQTDNRLPMHIFQPTSHRTHNPKCRCRQTGSSRG